MVREIEIIEPCPFCGQGPVECFVRSVSCQTVGCPLRGFVFEIKSWNKRGSDGSGESNA